MARKLEVEIVGDASSLRRAVGQADKSSSGLGRTFGGLGKTAALAGGAAGIGALVYGLKVGIGEFMQGQKVAAQTNAVLKATRDVANVTADHIDALAKSEMLKSGVDDEVIKSGENMLLTFKNIRNETGKGNKIFDQSVRILDDMTVALGTDPQKQAIQLGKALNDPIKGVSALARVGVTFTEQQKKNIKAMVDAGNTMGAQKLILRELNSEFGGSAKALGQTLGGQINIVRERFNNWAGDLVGRMIPAIQQFVHDATPAFKQFSAFITGTVLPAVQQFIGFIRDHMPEIRAQVAAMWAATKPILVNLGDLFVTVVGLIRKHWGTIGPILQTVVTLVRAALGIISGIIKVFAAVLKGDWGAAWEAVKQIAVSWFNGIKAMFRLWKQTVLALWEEIGTAILHGLKSGLEALPGLLKRAIQGLMHSVIQWAKDALGIKSPSTVFHGIGVNMIKGMANGVGSMGGYLKDAVVRIAKSAYGKLGSIAHAGGVGNVSGLTPRVLHAVEFARNHGWKGSVTSGFRTYAEQARLYDNYLHHGGNIAAAPGHSSHESGNAVDVTDIGGFARAMGQLPSWARLYSRVAGDPVHFSVSGYAKGGVVPGVGPQLAVVHGGETITPPGRNTTIQLVLPDGRLFAEWLFDPLRNKVVQVRAAGGTF